MTFNIPYWQLPFDRRVFVIYQSSILKMLLMHTEDNKSCICHLGEFLNCFNYAGIMLEFSHIVICDHCVTVVCLMRYCCLFNGWGRVPVCLQPCLISHASSMCPIARSGWCSPPASRPSSWPTTQCSAHTLCGCCAKSLSRWAACRLHFMCTVSSHLHIISFWSCLTVFLSAFTFVDLSVSFFLFLLTS